MCTCPPSPPPGISQAAKGNKGGALLCFHVCTCNQTTTADVSAAYLNRPEKGRGVCLVSLSCACTTQGSGHIFAAYLPYHDLAGWCQHDSNGISYRCKNLLCVYGRLRRCLLLLLLLLQLLLLLLSCYTLRRLRCRRWPVTAIFSSLYTQKYKGALSFAPFSPLFLTCILRIFQASGQ